MMMNNVKVAREGIGWSQREFSERLHIAQSLVCSIERERMYPWPKVRRDMADVLDTPESELFPEEQ